jgi:Protein of unknown function (DUF3040)
VGLSKDEEHQLAGIERELRRGDPRLATELQAHRLNHHQLTLGAQWLLGLFTLIVGSIGFAEGSQVVGVAFVATGVIVMARAAVRLMPD